MNNNSRYLLLIDPTEDILSLQETAINCFYSGEIFGLKDPSKAHDLFRMKGHPEMIIVDSDYITKDSSAFYRHLETEKVISPLIATTTKPHDQSFHHKFPSVTAFIEKSLNIASFSKLVRSLTSSQMPLPAYVPIKISSLIRLGRGHFDIYLKLSETNFVKIFHKGETLTELDCLKLDDKGIFELYLKQDEARDFLNCLQVELFNRAHDTLDEISVVLEDVESFEKIAKYLQWSPSILAAAHTSVESAVKIISKSKPALAELKKKLETPDSLYSKHIGLLTYLVCGFSQSVVGIGESGQVKLALAALMHDMCVDEKYYENIKEWNKRAADPSDKTSETVAYRFHPFEASKILKTMDTLLPDVEQIILQHHEVKDGSGFPRGLDSGRIGLLPALFIMVEDLMDFIGDGENIETSFTDYITWGREYYGTGHFKKIFSSFEEVIRKL